MSAPQDFFEKEAVLDEEEDGEGGAENEEGEEASKKRKAANHVDDSSEESEDDDEEAAREVQEGFIVDDEDEEPDARSARRREKKRRRQEEREREDEILDEEDLDLIGEANPGYKPPGPSQQSKFKRLKRGHRAEKDNINDMFNSEDEEEAEYGHERRRIDDGLGDFIEEDVFSDEEHAAVPDDEEVALPTKKGISGVAVTEATGLDEAALEDMRLAFGDGEDYRFALDIEDAEDNEQVEEKQLDLKDVFEPAQLAEKMMTEEDDIIRMTDEPERHQIARKPYAHVMLTMEQFQEEAVWISNMMLLKKRLDSDLHEPFQRAVSKVLEFMVTEDREVPFIFQHRKDYLIHAVKVPISPSADKGDGSGYEVTAQKLLNMLDLWEIFELDLKFRALIDKRNTLQKTYDNLQSLAEVHDDVFEALLPAAVTVDELQDIQEYVYFQYPVQLRDVAMINGSNNQNGAGRRKATTKTLYERVRGSRAYEIVKAFGITAEAFAKNASKEGARTYTEDPTERPDEMADNHLDSYFSNGVHVLKAAKAIFAEELVMSPRFRKVMRQAFFMNGIIECFRTEKGLKKIDEQHPYYEFKYLRNQQLSDIARRPELFLRMLKAEEEGLVDVKVQFENFDSFKKRSYRDIESDNQSELADAWNRERRDVLDMAFTKLENIMSRSVKENIRTECENHVAKECREAFAQRLDQAPYKPKGMVLGTVPRVLAITNGSGILGRDPLYWAWTEEDGRVLENGQFKDLTPGDSSRMIEDGADVNKFVDLVERRRPDVIGVSGFTPDSRKLQKLLTELVDVKDLRGSSYTDDDDREISDRLEVMIVNDEVARLYQGSDRANMEHPGFSVLTRYCVALAKYLQSPMKEYAALGRDIVSLTFKPGQQLVPQDKLLRHLESALVDMVNLCGVDINEAIIDTSTANLLPYICGLGPRKAAQLVKVINMNGGTVSNRIELLGESVRYPAMSVEVWRNSASFLFIDFDSADADADYLDNTRIHPEDYDIARKIAADALELDEEDIKAETDENGPGAIVRKLVKEDAQDSVNYLILEKYAEQLEKNLNQRKRATLETIRAELQQPYEELRKQFAYMSTDAIFTMFTGETSESLAEGMVVPVSLKRVTDDHVDGKLDCGVDAVASETELSDRYDIPIRTIFAPFQTVQAKVLSVNKKTFQAHISLRQARINQPYHRNLMHSRSEWDEKQEDEDREALREKDEKAGRAVRVIKHPLFRPFNAKQAEDFLSNQTRGDAVIRPSSKGPDHLAVTWKVSDGVYQHIDVLELDKENEYSVGRILRVGGRYSYSDLDELYVNHIRMMARKVDDMMVHEKYQTGTKEATEKWLATYIRANPTRSAYAFCIDPKHPGYFHLCFQAGARAQVQSWPVKVIPQGYELRRTPYPDMMALCNGFKMVFSNLSKAGGSGTGGMSGILNSGLGVGGYR